MSKLNDKGVDGTFRVIGYCWNIIDAKHVIEDCKKQNPNKEYVIRLQVIELEENPQK